MTKPAMKTSKITWAVCAITALVLLGWVAMLQRAPQLPADRTITTGEAQIGGPFQLTDHTGRAVTDKNWPGQYLLIYFGFTHCPDVCPTGLNTMAEALKTLPAVTAQRIQPLFITLDPARDDAAALKNYMPVFDKRLLGLTGTEAQIEAVKNAYRVYAQKTGDGPDYMVNHSAFTYLMAPDGTLATVFAHGITASDMAAGITKFVR